MAQWGWSALVAAGLTGSAALAGPMLRTTPPAAPALPDTRTVPCELSCSADYDVVLRDFDGLPMSDVTVRGCGDREVSDDAGVVTMDGRASSSDPLVFIQDGWFRTRPARCEMSNADGPRVLMATFDPRRTGGIGVMLYDKPLFSDAIPIRKVYPGSPAEEAGLVPGDLIIGVSNQTWEDGLMVYETLMSTEYTDADNLWRYTTGPEGTPVHLIVRSKDQEPRAVVLTRAFQDAPLSYR